MREIRPFRVWIWWELSVLREGGGGVDLGGRGREGGGDSRALKLKFSVNRKDAKNYVLS